MTRAARFPDREALAQVIYRPLVRREPVQTGAASFFERASQKVLLFGLACLSKALVMTFRSVSIFSKPGGWVVAVIEDGIESRQSFRDKARAKAFADGHRIRLGLPITDKVLPFTPPVPQRRH